MPQRHRQYAISIDLERWCKAGWLAFALSCNKHIIWQDAQRRRREPGGQPGCAARGLQRRIRDGTPDAGGPRHLHYAASRDAVVAQRLPDADADAIADAALRVAATLKKPALNVMATAFSPVPSPLRDGVYRLVANNRYSILGKDESGGVESCKLRADAMTVQERFLG